MYITNIPSHVARAGAYDRHGEPGQSTPGRLPGGSWLGQGADVVRRQVAHGLAEQAAAEVDQHPPPEQPFGRDTDDGKRDQVEDRAE